MFDNSSILNPPEPTLDDLDLTDPVESQGNDEVEILQLVEDEMLGIQKAYEIFRSTHPDSIPEMRQISFLAEYDPSKD